MTHSERSCLGILERGRVGIGDQLGYPVMVTQIDEQQSAMIANAVAPAGKAGFDADMGLAHLAAAMGPITMHA